MTLLFDEAGIRSAELALERAFASSDPTEWVNSYAEDAVFVAPGAPAVVGRDALLAMAKRMHALSSFRIKPVRTVGSGHMAAVYVDASWVSADTPTDVRSLMVWRKESDGQWRVALELLHENADAAT